MSEVAKTNTEVQASQPPSPVQVFQRQLSSYESNIVDLLGSRGVSPKEFMVTAINAVKKNPELLNCDRATLFAGILTSAELGLPANTPMNYSYLIPYNRKKKEEGGRWNTVKEVQFQIGYQGWIELIMRNPRVESVDSSIIYENEKWYYNPGKREPFSHEPLPPSKRGEAIATYAIVWLKESSKPKVTVLYKEDIDKFKAISQAANSDYSPWNQVDKDPMKWMWRKTALKQIAKEIPKTRETSKAHHIDDVVEMGGTVRLADPETAEVVVDEIADTKKLEKAEAKSEAAAQATKDLFDKQKG